MSGSTFHDRGAFSPSSRHSDLDDEHDANLDPSMLAIRSAFAKSRGGAQSVAPSDDDVQILPRPSSARPSSVAPGFNGSDDVMLEHVGEEGEAEEDQVAIRVSLMMDPDRKASAMARKGYETPMVPIKLGVVSRGSPKHSSRKAEKLILSSHLQHSLPRRSNPSQSSSNKSPCAELSPSTRSSSRIANVACTHLVPLTRYGSSARLTFEATRRRYGTRWRG